jgi:peptidoglycan/xylan/chitin deacetylase (PgdA/CDA1 family)
MIDSSRRHRGAHHHPNILPGLLAALLIALRGISWASPIPSPPRPTLDPQHLAEAITGAYEGNDRDPYWIAAKETTYRKVAELLSQDQAERSRDIRADKVLRGNPYRRWVCLTFDDGPHPNYTPRLLEILKRENVKATFFVVGMMAELFPELLRAEAEAGHSIGNHTYHHVNLSRIPYPYAAVEIAACDRVLSKILGGKPHLFRPPGGDYDDRTVQIANALGYTVVLWTDDPGDYAKPSDFVLKLRLYGRLSNGGIILLHDGVEQTIRILPSLIENLRKLGYEFVTPDEMFGLSNRKPSASDREDENPAARGSARIAP